MREVIVILIGFPGRVSPADKFGVYERIQRMMDSQKAKFATEDIAVAHVKVKTFP